MDTLTLKIYEGKNVIKEYKAETIDFSYGVIVDVLKALDFEHMTTGSNLELSSMIAKCTDIIPNFLMDLFDGVTAEEVRHTRISNLIEIFRNLYFYATQELKLAVGKTKN